jgi:hypothetical protein
MIRGTTKNELQWCWDMIGYSIPGPFSGITFELNDELHAVAIFYHHTANDCEVALAAKNISKTFLRALFAYSTETLKVSRLTLKTPINRIDTVKLYRRLGATFEGTQKAFYPNGIDAALYRLDRENFRFK